MLFSLVFPIESLSGVSRLLLYELFIPLQRRSFRFDLGHPMSNKGGSQSIAHCAWYTSMQVLTFPFSLRLYLPQDTDQCQPSGSPVCANRGYFLIEASVIRNTPSVILNPHLMQLRCMLALTGSTLFSIFVQPHRQHQGSCSHDFFIFSWPPLASLELFLSNSQTQGKRKATRALSIGHVA